MAVANVQRPEDVAGRYRFLHRMAVISNREKALAKQEWDKIMKLRHGADALAEEKARKLAEAKRAAAAAAAAAAPPKPPTKTAGQVILGALSSTWSKGTVGLGGLL